jgi:hypothetical protein
VSAALLVGVVLAGVAKADATFVVVNSGMTAYLVSGFAGNNPTLTLVKGQTYSFQVSSPGHPFFISTTANSPAGPHFTTGVTNENVTAGTLVFVVPATAPATLFYQCTIHGAMSGRLDIVAPPAVPAMGGMALLGLAAAVLAVGFIHLRKRARA